MNEFDFEIIENASLEKLNTYGIKTRTQYLAKPNSKFDLQNLVSYLEERHIPYLLLGKGSNVILPDTPFKGVVISLENLAHVQINDNVVVAECGVLLGSLIQKVVLQNLSGMEGLIGIPGTLGGALWGNAGANKMTIYDCLESVEVLRHNQFITLKKDDIEIDYRYTEFKKKNDILVTATFKMQSMPKEKMHEVMHTIQEKRKNSQPLEFKNAGSVFKNPAGDYAGRIIESLNLKGLRVGDAEISSKHANFIINRGSATSKDIKELIKLVQEKVFKEANIKLELEQNIIEWD